MNELAPPFLRADAQRNRERLLAAAAELFRARELDVSMEDIAREAGVGVGTLYRRFRNRDEIIDALFESRLAEFSQVVRKCAAMPDGWAGLVCLLERTLEIQAADRGLKHLFHSRDNRHLNVDEVRDLMLDALAQMTSRAQAAGDLRRDVKPMDIAMLSFQVGSLADLTADHDPGAWRRALAIALDGLRPRSDPGRKLPPGPIGRDSFEAALECWRPPAAPETNH
ncbi:MAG: TetR/AcrR family transcriptional regulator [Solirubrobacteraceae bacterium]